MARLDTRDGGWKMPKEAPRKRFYPARFGVTEEDEAPVPEAVAARGAAARWEGQALPLAAQGAASHAAAGTLERTSPPVQFVAAPEVHAAVAGAETCGTGGQPGRCHVPMLTANSRPDPQAVAAELQPTLAVSDSAGARALGLHQLGPEQQHAAAPGLASAHNGGPLSGTAMKVPRRPAGAAPDPGMQGAASAALAMGPLRSQDMGEPTRNFEVCSGNWNPRQAAAEDVLAGAGTASRDWWAPQGCVESRKRVDNLAPEVTQFPGSLEDVINAEARIPGSVPDTGLDAEAPGEQGAGVLGSSTLAPPDIGSGSWDARLLGSSSAPEGDLSFLDMMNQDEFANTPAEAGMGARETAGAVELAGYATRESVVQSEACMSSQSIIAMAVDLAEMDSMQGKSCKFEPVHGSWEARGSLPADCNSFEGSRKPFEARNMPHGMQASCEFRRHREHRPQSHTQSKMAGTPDTHEMQQRRKRSEDVEVVRSKQEGEQYSSVRGNSHLQGSQGELVKEGSRQGGSVGKAGAWAHDRKAKPKLAERKKRPAEGLGGPVPAVLDDVVDNTIPEHPTSAIPPEVRGIMSTHWVLLGQDLQRKGVTLGIERFLVPKPSSSRSSSSDGSNSGRAHSKSMGGSTEDCTGKPEREAGWEDRSGGAGGHLEAVAEADGKNTGAPSLLRRLSRVMDAIQDPQNTPGNRLHVEEEPCWALTAHTPWSQPPSSGEGGIKDRSRPGELGAESRVLALRQGSTLAQAGSVAASPLGLGAEADTGRDRPVRLRLVRPLLHGEAAVPSPLIPQAAAAHGVRQALLRSAVLRNSLGLQRICSGAAALKDLVMLAAQAVESHNLAQFEAVGAHIQNVARRRGIALERLAQVMLEMLAARARGEGFSFANRRVRVTTQDFNNARMWYFTGSPAHGFFNIALSGVMLPYLQGKQSVHFVLVGEAMLPQLGSIIRLLAHKPALEWHGDLTNSGGGQEPLASPDGAAVPLDSSSREVHASEGPAQVPRHRALQKLRITSVSSWQLVRPGRAEVEHMKEPGRVADLLSSVAARVGVEFEFTRRTLLSGDLQTNLHKLLQDAARRDPEEVLVCCGCLDVKFLQVAELHYPQDASPVLLTKFLKESRPDLIAIGEETVDASCKSFLPRLSAYYDFTFAEWEVHDAISVPGGKKALHVIEQQYFIPNLLSTLAYDGPQPRLQPRSAAGWAAVMASAGYPPCRISPRVSEALHEFLESYPDGFGVLHTETAVQMMWRGMPYLGVLYWHKPSWTLQEV